MRNEIIPIETRLFRDRQITESGCWEWTGSLKQKNGYGRMQIKGKNQQVHRVSYAHFNGPIKKDLWVLHRCDNKKCFNPSHLFLGTRQDNMNDMIQKNRQHRPTGIKNPTCKLTPILVSVIREAVAAGYKQTEIGIYFKLPQPTISAIHRRITWKHI